jgi:hypothetical protein
MYSYAQCLQNAHKINWRIDEVLDGRRFDPSRRWLPGALSAADQIDFLDEDERRKLAQIEMASYAHLFGYVEEFIAPTVVDLAHEIGRGERVAFDALANFAAEEVKHMQLFRAVRDRIHASLGFDLELLGGQDETTAYVRSKNTGAVLLLTACIEWLTQRHYLECFKDNEELDPFTRHLFRCHWLEESQHAQMDHLETVRAFEGMSAAERDLAVSDLIELVGAVDGLLQQQARFDTRNFGRYLDRALTEEEQEQLFDRVLQAKRYTFLETGVTHPRFLELFTGVTTPAQQERVQEALAPLLPELSPA